MADPFAPWQPGRTHGSRPCTPTDGSSFRKLALVPVCSGMFRSVVLEPRWFWLHNLRTCIGPMFRIIPLAQRISHAVQDIETTERNLGSLSTMFHYFLRLFVTNSSRASVFDFSMRVTPMTSPSKIDRQIVRNRMRKPHAPRRARGGLACVRRVIKRVETLAAERPRPRI